MDNKNKPAIDKTKLPIFQDKEGSMRVAIFKNKNVKGSVYPIICITAFRFPTQYSRKLYINPGEVGKLIKVLERVPEIEIKKPKKIKVKV